MDLPATNSSTPSPPATPVGTWLMAAATSTAEAMGCAGFDFVVVDMEHVPIDTPQMIDILRTVAGTPAAAVTRVPWNDMVMVKRALDAGAQTLMFPFVQNAGRGAAGGRPTPAIRPTACAASRARSAPAATARFRTISGSPQPSCASSSRSRPSRR